jgi:hypothetical protein
VCDIQVTNKLIEDSWIWHIEIAIHQGAAHEGNVWDIHKRLLPPIYYTVRLRLTKIAVHTFEGIVTAREALVLIFDNSPMAYSMS